MPSASEPRAPARPAPPAPASASAGTDLLGKVPPPLLLGTGILSVQVGAGLAARMFGTVSAAGLTGLRPFSPTGRGGTPRWSSRSASRSGS